MMVCHQHNLKKAMNYHPNEIQSITLGVANGQMINFIDCLAYAQSILIAHFSLIAETLCSG